MSFLFLKVKCLSCRWIHSGTDSKEETTPERLQLNLVLKFVHDMGNISFLLKGL